jgi:hypothetical protein
MAGAPCVAGNLAAAQANPGVSRQRADWDAHAAYLNTLRWYISGDTNNADVQCASAMRGRRP